MIRVAVIGDIGSGKSYVAKLFGYPVFNADLEVAKIYNTNRGCFKKLKKKLPKYFFSFPVKKSEIINAIMANQTNIKKITNIIHPEIRKKMNIFLKTNKKKRAVILDVPLFLENSLNNKGDVLIFIQSKKTEILKRLKKRKSFSLNLLNRFKKIQLSTIHKKKKAQFVIKNDFTSKSVKKSINKILKELL
jgi:dephospho-CoA kinase|tara:strand:- start:78 stop:647 length:570 start_codon:yes stop_codon:yes gene_type:complete